MTIAELNGFVGQSVKITLFDGTILEGKLGFVKEFSKEYGYKKPNYFFIDNDSFKVSHIKYFDVDPRQQN